MEMIDGLDLRMSIDDTEDASGVAILIASTTLRDGVTFLLLRKPRLIANVTRT
jgi:hypothetical protein